MYGQLSTKYRSESSYNGYSLDVLKSALQKYIRRSDTEKAIYAAAELDLFSLDHNGERIRTNFIHRLMVIFMEDIYNPSLWTLIDQLIFDLLRLRKEREGISDISDHTFCEKRREEVKIICRIVNALAKSPHSRENSYYKYSAYLYLIAKDDIKKKIKKKFPQMKEMDNKLKIKYNPLSVPLFLEDVKDEETRELITNFIGSLENRHDICIYYAHKLNSFKEAPFKFYNSKKPSFMIFYLIDFVLKRIGHPARDFIELAKRWYKELNPIKEDFLCWQNILLYVLKGDREYSSYIEDPNTRRLNRLYKRNVNEEKIEFDEWVYDMHTRVGKKQGKGSEYFAKESSFVSNEIADVNQLYKDVYTYSKILQDKNSEEKEEEKEKDIKKSKQQSLESKYSRFVMRAQLVTGDSKTDTYYGEKDGKLIFIKGPIELESAVPFLELQKVKKIIGLPTLNYEVVYLKPDLFGKTPLGRRNFIDREELHPFIICDVLFDHTAEDLPYRLHSSKLWPETKLVDFDKVKGMEHLDPSHLENEKILKEYVRTIVFRYIMGLGDIAPRNFIVKNEKLYSIDEDLIDKDFSLINNLKRTPKNYKKLMDYIIENKESVLQETEKYERLALTDGNKRRLKHIIEFIQTGKIEDDIKSANKKKKK